MRVGSNALKLSFAAVGALCAVAGVVFARPFISVGGLVVASSAATAVFLAPRVRNQQTSPLATDEAPSLEGALLTARLAGDEVPDVRLVDPEPVGVEPSDALESFARSVSGVGEVLAAHLWLLDPATQTMRMVAAVGSLRPDGEPVPASDSLAGRTATEGIARLEADRRAIVEDVERTVWHYAVPLRTPTAAGVAILDLTSADEPDRPRLNRAAAHARGALTAALALYVSRLETEGAEMLLATASELFRLVDELALLKLALGRAMGLSHAETGSIMLVSEDDGRMRIGASVGLPEHVARTTEVSAGEGIAGWVLATGKSMIVEDLEDRGPRSRRHGIRSAAAVPIADEDGIIGVLNVGNRSFQTRVFSTHLVALEALGRALALAIRNARAVETTRDLYFDTVKALALALETKDPYSRGTTERVHELSTRLGEFMGLTDAELGALGIASLLHDLGMAAAGDVTQVSERPLTTVEWGMLKMHPVIAADVLEQAESLRQAVPIVYHHHERYDGSGYVLGLAGEQIPIGARVLSVADAFVAMTSPRPYRGPMSQAEALAELTANAGTQFDPEVVGALAELLGSSEKKSPVQS